MTLVHEDPELPRLPENLVRPVADRNRPSEIQRGTTLAVTAAPGGGGPTEIMLAAERFIAAGDADRRDAFRSLVHHLKRVKAEGQFDELAGGLRFALTPTLDYTSAQSLNQFFKALPESAKPQSRIRLAILGGFTTHQLRDLVELFLFAAGISADVYESDYGVFRQEILDPNSGLHQFQPNVVFLATHWRNVGRWPALSDSAEAVGGLLDAEYRDWAALWQMLHERLGAQVLQNNFDAPSWRTLANHEMRHAAAHARFIADLNRALAEGAPSFVTIHDVDAIASNAGRRAWGDERFFLHAKMPCAPEYLVDYAHSVASLLAAQRGLSRKCLVLDLDNTIWGGVIGDDGLGGIRIGEGDAESESFLAFQRYVKALQTRGVILAVCSKNDERTAREVFEQHPDMILKLDDISCFIANWTDKATNLRGIAKQLNIGLDSLVFVDDNPAERSIIRQLVPEVAVPEISTDPIDFVAAIERHRYFQVASLGSEDFKRTEYYRSNAERAQIEATAGGIDEFLRSLEMTSVIGPIQPQTLERSTQLINKSNQFNLTTRRRNVAEIQALSQSPDWTTTTVTLTDRFGENGLISVVLARAQQDELEIDTWVMSCRVLKRGLERFLLNHLCDEASKRGLRYITGQYIPTARNGLVRDHFAELGFECIEKKSDGHSLWRLSLANREPLSNFIKKVQ
jgi:FkbH-like protein